MIITKHRLVESVVAERSVDDYLKVGGLPKADVKQMDAEFYGDTTMYVWEDIRNIIDHYLKGDAMLRNKWAFESDLNAEQMRWLEHHPNTVTVEMVQRRYSDKQVYDMVKAYKLNTPEEMRNLASYLLADSIPKL